MDLCGKTGLVWITSRLKVLTTYEKSIWYRLDTVCCPRVSSLESIWIPDLLKLHSFGVVFTLERKYLLLGTFLSILGLALEGHCPLACFNSAPGEGWGAAVGPWGWSCGLTLPNCWGHLVKHV